MSVAPAKATVRFARPRRVDEGCRSCKSNKHGDSISLADRAAMARLYQDYQSTAAIGIKFDCSSTTVARILKQDGVRMRKAGYHSPRCVRTNSVSPADRSLMVQLYESGQSTIAIGLRVNRPNGTVSRILHQEGVVMRSPGCQHPGWSKHPLYPTWHGIKKRCHHPKCPAFPAYGGRGIYMCDSWANNFEQFLADVGPRPSLEHSLDRIDRIEPAASLAALAAVVI